MNPNKHEEYFEIDGMRGFITGIPDRCNHVYDEHILILGNGDIISVKDYLCPTNEETQKYITKIVEDKNTFIETGTTRCLKCKKIYVPDFNEF